MRKVQFTNEEFYHIYNCGVEKRDIYREENEYIKFLSNLKYFNNKSYYEEREFQSKEPGSFLKFLEKEEKIVEIIAFSLAPNHFHLILKQLKEKGISNFMHKVGTSFSNFINKKYNRIGSLFQGPFKAIHIDNNDYLLWLSGYVNGNIEIHKLAKVESYKWSSFRYFLGLEESKFLGEKDIILDQFKDTEDYKDFVEMVIRESRAKKEMEKYFLE